MKFNPDASMAIISFADTSVQILSTMLGDKLYEINDDALRFPVTAWAWKPTKMEGENY